MSILAYRKKGKPPKIQEMSKGLYTGIDGTLHEYQGHFKNSPSLKGCLIET